MNKAMTKTATRAVKALLLLLLSSTAFANLPRAQISNVGLSVYAAFTTSDPSCQVGLISSIPFNKSPTVMNFVNAPTLGAGPISSRIACVVLVVANQIQVDWKASSYTGADNVCSAGGAANINTCIGVTPSWPPIITQSAALAGVTLATNCPASPAGTEIVPVYMSTISSCTGNSVVDQATSGCTVSGKTTSTIAQSPSTANSVAGGARIQQNLPINGRMVFVVDPDQIISGSSGTCSAIAAPAFSIHQ